MRKWVLLAVPLLALAAAAWAVGWAQDKPQTPAEQVQALQAEFNKARTDYLQAAREAKTLEDRKKAIEKLPKVPAYVAKFMEIADRNAADPAAVDALVWVVQNAGTTPDGNKAMDLLSGATGAKHPEKLAPLAAVLSRSYSPGAEKLLRLLAEKAKDKEAAGTALYALAQHLKSQVDAIHNLREGGRQAQFISQSLGQEQAAALKAKDPAIASKEAEKVFERVIAEYGDVKQPRGTLAEVAKADLFEVRNLSIGRTVPEIDAEDTDGTKFKLSDYRGKVVMLDFWGHW